MAQREGEDAQQLQAKLKRALSEAERGALGVSRLRAYLERLLQRRYLESVPLIVPLLEQEFRTAVRPVNAAGDMHCASNCMSCRAATAGGALAGSTAASGGGGAGRSQ